MVSTPARRPTRTPSVLSMCAAVDIPSLCASSQVARAISGDMRSTPGSPSTSASNTPPVTNSFTRSHLRAKQARTASRASSGVETTFANRPAPWPPGTVTPVPDVTSRGPGVLPGVDGVAHVHVGEGGVAHRAHRGHAARQLLLRVLAQHPAQVPHADRVARHLVDEVACAARAHGLAGAAQMHVRVDHSRHEIGAAQVDLARAGGRHGGGGRADGLDAAAVHDDGHVRLRLHPLRAVEHGGMGEDVGRHGFPFVGWRVRNPPEAPQA